MPSTFEAEGIQFRIGNALIWKNSSSKNMLEFLSSSALWMQGQDFKVEISVTKNIENEDSLLIIFDSYKW